MVKNIEEYSELLEDKDLRRWYENVGRGSKITADVYLRRLGNFYRTYKKTPKELIKLSERGVYNLILDVIGDMESKKFSGSYIHSVIKAIKSWLAFNGKDIKRKIRIKGVQETPTLDNERIPTQDELKKIFLAGDEKTRTACAFLAHSGLRPEVLGNYRGDDGLKISDLPELEIKGDKVEFKKIPALIRVRPTLSKTGKEYLTFLSEEGCEYLKAYLEMRLRTGKLTENSAIITPKLANKEFITSINIGDAIRKALRKSGFPWRPYVLRSYFDTQMMIAESKGLIIRDYRTFFMGHKGDIEHVYTLNKKRLPENIVENLRESYKKAQKYLQTGETGKDEEITKSFKKQLLLVAGFKTSEIEDSQLALNDDEFQKLVRGKLLKSMENNGIKQKIIPTAHIENYITQGWEFVSNLPDNRAVIRVPEN
ncbi:MAG: site-specific integrase [Candidatus Pacearchaeota archaeon]|nr:site-specific integrase [Candidatus Pacearchaeota archaeon]